jgi:hypothetical protein
MAVALPQMLSPPPAVVGAPANATARQGGVEEFVRLKISPQGAVETCALELVSGYGAFDLRFCSLISRAQFRPATDAEGNPLYGVVGVGVHYLGAEVSVDHASPDVELTLERLPAGASIHPVAQLAVLVSSDGRLEACEVVTSSGVAALDHAACASGLASIGLQAATDQAGTRVRSLQSVNVGFGAFAAVVLKKDPAYAGLGASGPYFPERAQRLGVPGYAIIECDADADGVLTGCDTREEYPHAFGFALSAKKMAETKWMRAVPGPPRKVLIRVDYPLAPHFRRRP